MKGHLVLLLGGMLLLSGCTLPSPSPEVLPGEQASYRLLGFDGTTWPDLHGERITILAYNSYIPAFKKAAALFHNKTNATAFLVTEADSGRVLERAIREKGNPTFDIIYGIDNILASRAIREGVFEPYRPLLSSRIPSEWSFLPNFEATPVNHGYIALNVDPRSNITLTSLDDLQRYADKFVTEDPRTSTPGLGFLIATVATYGEEGPYSFVDYWRDLLRNGTLVVADWDLAYVGHFSGGFGQFQPGTSADRPIVTSYTTSPAYEVYYGYGTLNSVLVAPNSTFHQIQTMGIAKGTRHRAAAEAWIEFTLTDEWQSLAASEEAIYPIVPSVPVDSVFKGLDPHPSTLKPAPFSYEVLGEKLEGWIRSWTEVYESSRT